MLGGKSAISFESKLIWKPANFTDVEKFFVIRGIIEPPSGDVNTYLKS